MNSGMRASRTPYANCVTRASSASLASSVVAIGPAFSSVAAKTEPSSSQPRFGVTSAHDASGPGAVANRPRE